MTAAMSRPTADTPPGLGAKLLSIVPTGVRLTDEAWQRRHRSIQLVLWIQIPTLLIVGLARHYAVGHVLLEAAPVIFFAVAGRTVGSRGMKAILVCTGLLSSSAVLVHFTNGLIDAHFSFFVLIPLVALHQDIIAFAFAFAFAIAFVSVEHVIKIMVDSKSVFNHPGAQAKPLLWAGVHAGFVVVLVVIMLVMWKFTEETQMDLADLQA